MKNVRYIYNHPKWGPKLIALSCDGVTFQLKYYVDSRRILLRQSTIDWKNSTVVPIWFHRCFPYFASHLALLGSLDCAECKIEWGRYNNKHIRPVTSTMQWTSERTVSKKESWWNIGAPSRSISRLAVWNTTVQTLQLHFWSNEEPKSYISTGRLFFRLAYAMLTWKNLTACATTIHLTTVYYHISFWLYCWQIVVFDMAFNCFGSHLLTSKWSNSDRRRTTSNQFV